MIIRERYQEYDEDYEVEFHLRNFVNRILLELNSFLEYLVNFHPDYFLPYVRVLGKEFSKIIAEKQDLPEAVQSILKNFRLQRRDGKVLIVDFFRILRNKLIQVSKISLNLQKYYVSRRTKKMQITILDRVSGRIIPKYVMAVVLKEIMPREEALQFYKEYLEYLYIDGEKREPIMEMIEQMLELYESEYKETFNFTTLKIDQGKVGIKIEQCMTHKALKHLFNGFDKEFGYLVACYPDFLTINRMNESFVLTREKSLIMGNSYCD
ncbi:MAG: L-2-amino-thiazoline-4-carboxylic acid hydrolase, partial [Candidatus Heimdallarchaeota archaeon]|nr:L-2-amino-thiazoline-4-carboxylic acid hydrolase [Candidatus Heimdallarchaeota archaeon]MCK4876314.1 L-2-amino-thiazoline-4-carboxylic acid hydrolase [Candidatus Heimdallarchaeota archaeon]